MKNKILPVLALVLGILSSCKKDINQAITNVNPPGTASDKMKDSVLLYTRDIYLWYSQIPSDFAARTFADPEKIMEAVRNYSTDPGFEKPVDRWSFAIKQAEWDNVSSGVAADFGLGVFFSKEGDLRVKSVEKDSPAGRAGVRRGWRITKINGNSNLTTTNSSFIVANVFESKSSSFSLEKTDGSSVDLVLNATSYHEHPVVLDSVYTVASKKVGYLVFNSFLGDTTEIYNEFQRIFSRFSRENINEIVVDLRYNGGGYVNVQEKLANYLVNASGNGNVMMNQVYNDKYKQMNSTTRFGKMGALNLSRVFFIVSSGTASASELLINNLKPYLDVKLSGPSATYGKPVGFFPIPLDDWYLFPVSFRSTNKNGEGNYFNGIPIDNQVQDGLNKDWGDVDESCLASVLKFIGTGSFTRTTEGTTGVQSRMENTAIKQVASGNAILNDHAFKGTVETRRW